MIDELSNRKKDSVFSAYAKIMEGNIRNLRKNS
jgi:hypothetical protein